MRFVLIGAGQRGMIYARCVQERGHEIAAVAERDPQRREAARQAFASCPMASNTLAVCASAVARPALNLLRDAHLAARLTDYLVFGPAGRDGAKGTDDDISDPFAELAVRLGRGVE